jgi:hypothetical protein
MPILRFPSINRSLNCSVSNDASGNLIIKLARLNIITLFTANLPGFVLAQIATTTNWATDLDRFGQKLFAWLGVCKHLG